MSLIKGFLTLIMGTMLLLPGLVWGQKYHIEIQLKGLSEDTVILGE